jgi:hypothetical protein
MDREKDLSKMCQCLLFMGLKDLFILKLALTMEEKSIKRL